MAGEVEITAVQDTIVVKLKTKDAAEAYADLLQREGFRARDQGFGWDGDEIHNLVKEVWP